MKEDLLATARLGHLATASETGRPHVVPVCFSWLPPLIYSAIDGKPKRTMLLRRIRNIAETGRAALVVDRWSEDWTKLAYVLVEGPAEVLADGRERDEALILLTAKYPQYDDLPLEGNLVIKLVAEHVVEWHALMEFGFTLKPDHSLERIASLTKLAEECGFTYGWVFDSHVLWKEPYVLLTLMAQNSSTLRLGTCVTNPATREPSVTASALAVLQILSKGRMDLGIGRGDSARRVLGKKPTTLDDLEAATLAIRDLCEGRATTYDGTEIKLDWAERYKLPVWIAGYGPKALAVTGRIADGAVIQIADPSLVKWCVGLLREGTRAAHRQAADVKVMVAAPAHVGPKAEVRERVRWFPALVSNHVVDLVRRYGEQGLPADLTRYVRDRPGYDYKHHAESGSSNAGFVDDESVDRFCVTGEVNEQLEKLHALADAGMTQFNLYLMSGDEERQLEAYGKDVIPKLRGARATA